MSKPTATIQFNIQINSENSHFLQILAHVQFLTQNKPQNVSKSSN